MTKQEIFDIVATHLLQQNAKSTRAGARGCYLSRVNGLLRCRFLQVGIVLSQLLEIVWYKELS